MMKSRINRNLISLKCVIFAFFAGLGCLFPFLALHMVALGLTRDEARVISIVAPCVAALGPIVAGLLLDRLSIGRGGGNNSSNVNGSGRLLRFILAACLLLAALFYGLLLSVPAVKRFEARRPSVSFTCSSSGAVVLQERCTEEKTCYNWDGEKSGALRVSDCVYACEAPPAAYGAAAFVSSTTDSSLDAADDDDEIDSEPNFESENTPSLEQVDELEHIVKPPHLCHDEAGKENHLCQVYTKDTKQLIITARLLSGTQNNETDNEDWCTYPLAQYFQCTVPEMEVQNLQANFNETCNPVVVCQVDDPYDSPNSVLAESQCMQLIGDPNTTFWAYLVLRSIADIFPTTALGLVGTACVIATRETSLGRGDVGRQLAFGAIGLAIFPPLMGLGGTQSQTYVTPIVVFIVFMIIAAVILLADSSMPLSPPEWWWHTECGLLAMPMSSVRRYSTEIAAVAAVLVLLGTFWGALDNYISWTLQDLKASDLLIGLTLTFGAIPAIPVLWWAERVVDYCGHSNLLITAFTFYIFRYTGMSLMENADWVLLYEALEVFTLSLAWVTAVLYLRHLVPRKFTSTGQAVPVVAHFCIGRCIGAIIGGFVSEKDPDGEGSLESVRCIYRGLAVAACVVAALYLALYHLLLAPRCRAPSTGSPVDMLQGLNQNGRSNGGYDQLRVYHNERGRKGQFRY